MLSAVVAGREVATHNSGQPDFSRLTEVQAVRRDLIAPISRKPRYDAKLFPAIEAVRERIEAVQPDQSRVEQIAAQYKDHGFPEPLLVGPGPGGDMTRATVVDGDQLWRAAERLELSHLPCQLCTGLPDYGITRQHQYIRIDLVHRFAEQPRRGADQEMMMWWA